MSFIIIGIIAYFIVGIILEILQYFHIPWIFRPKRGWKLLRDFLLGISLWPLTAIGMAIFMLRGKNPWVGKNMMVSIKETIHHGDGTTTETSWP